MDLNGTNRFPLMFEYDLILLGKKNTFSPFFFNYNKEQNKRMALYVFKYAIEKYLKWSPEEAATYLNYEVVKFMKLDGLLRYIEFPAELDKHVDLFYIAHLLYPGRIKFDKKELILRTYKEVLDQKLYKFPKEYLSGSMGVIRACVCFQYMVSQFLPFNNIEEMYNFFSSTNGVKALKKYRLYAICTDIFDYPIDYLHEALSENQKNEFFYHYYKFVTTNREQITEMKKKGTYII